MKNFLIFIIFLIIEGTTNLLIAQQLKASDFNEDIGEILLPKVVVVPKHSTFSAILRQVNNNEFIVEPNSITPINSSITTYEPNKGLLHIPAITIKDKIYKNVQLELVKPSTNVLHFRIVSIEKEINKDTLKNVQATLETQPVRMGGDSADDPAIWVNPQEPSKSIIIGTQKKGGIGVYDLMTGKEIQYLPEGHINNIDIRTGFPLNDKHVAIVAASDRSNDSIVLYKVNPNKRILENVATHTVGLKNITYGLCMYHSFLSGKYYVFINDKGGAVEQWEIFDNNGFVNATLVRNFKVGSIVEGCVADDVLGHFYLGEEQVGIWKFSAEPDGGNDGYLIDKTTGKGKITPAVEGLTLYYINKTEGYLIASNQGNNTYTVYNRAGDNNYLGQFNIIANETLDIDAVEDTDGIDVINISLGEMFPYGVFIAQDGKNASSSKKQNFKLVPWEKIADALGLKKESFYEP